MSWYRWRWWRLALGLVHAAPAAWVHELGPDGADGPLWKRLGWRLFWRVR